MTLYNILFPIWIIIWIAPLIWIIAGVVNFLWDSAILAIGIKMEEAELKENYKSSILRVWGCGFLADFLGSLMLLGISFLDIKGNFMYALQFKPFSNIFAFMTIAVCIFITGVLIYWMNMKYCLKKTDLTDEQKKHIALKIAVFTAPYILLFPSYLLYF